jgi:DNA-directed RNA polymerase specialized sigma24 family protein
MTQHHMTAPASDMHTFVRNLPDVDRQVLMLHYAEELSPREIAMVLGLGVAQVENRLSALRAIARAVVGTSTLSKAG